MEKEISSAKQKKGERKMRKEFIICAIVIALVVGFNIITQNYTTKSVETINQKLEELKGKLEQEEIEKEEVEGRMEEIQNTWKEKYDKLAFFIEHDELEKVETELTSLNAHIEIEEYQEAIPELEKGVFILHHIDDKFKLDIKNIF